MTSLIKMLVALGFAVGALGFTAAAADHGSKPAYCASDHDHRAHNADYYDYYPQDRFYRAGPYRGSDRRSGLSVSLSFGDSRYNNDGYGGRYNDRRYNERRYNDRRYNERRYNEWRGRRIVKRRVYNTRYRARIVLVEEAIYRGRRQDRVCTVDARGPEARYVPRARLSAIAYRDCSRRARVRVV